MVNVAGDYDLSDMVGRGGAGGFPNQVVLAEEVINHEGYDPHTFENGNSGGTKTLRWFVCNELIFICGGRCRSHTPEPTPDFCSERKQLKLKMRDLRYFKNAGNK